jgi:two-component system cell cycle response regulator
VSDTGRNKTVVTAISKISDRPVAKEACLVVIYGLELGKKFNLTRPRSSSAARKADIQIDQEAVSRNHCKIINTGNAIMLRDMGSTNGTYVNDEMIDEYVLRDGDFIKVGRCIFKFLSGNNIENAYHEEIYRLTTVDGLTQIFNRGTSSGDARARDRAGAALSPRSVADHVRHRPVQGRQRHLRSPRRRLTCSSTSRR